MKTKKTMKDIFDRVTAVEMDRIVQQNTPPDVPQEVLLAVKEKVYAKTGIKQSKKKNFVLYLTAVAAACICITVGVLWTMGNLELDSMLSESGDDVSENQNAHSNDHSDKDFDDDTPSNQGQEPGSGVKPNDGSGNGNTVDGGDDGSFTEQRGARLLTVARELTNDPIFQYENGNPYCFYASDTNGFYRVIWNDFEGLKEEDQIVVEFSSYREINETSPSGKRIIRYEMIATSVQPRNDADHKGLPYLEMTAEYLHLEVGKSYSMSNHYCGGSYDRLYFDSLDSTIVRVSDSGEIDCLAPGETEIIITAVNAYGTNQYRLPVKSIDMLDVPVINATKDRVELIVGDSFNIMEYIEVSNYTNIYFDSLYPEDISVDAEGNVTAHKEATVYIRVIAEKDVLVSEVEICVVGIETIPNVLLIEGNARLEIGQTYKLGEVIFTTARTVYYESVDPSVATVNDEGVITGVSAGNATIQIYIEFGGQRILANTFSVCVKTPLTPDNSIEEEIVDAQGNLTQFETFFWYNVNITSRPEYNMNDEQNTSPGPVEIWQDTLQLYLSFQRDEVDATIGWKDQATYNFYFDFYYCPYDDYQKVGEYKKATLQAWSVYDAPEVPIYRCKFYDAFEMENDPLVEGQLYDVVIVVREGDTALGYAQSKFVWTDSCRIFTEYAEAHPEIIK